MAKVQVPRSKWRAPVWRCALLLLIGCQKPANAPDNKMLGKPILFRLQFTNGSTMDVASGDHAFSQKRHGRNIINTAFAEVYRDTSYSGSEIQIRDSNTVCYNDAEAVSIYCVDVASGEKRHLGIRKGRGPGEMEGVDVFSSDGSTIVAFQYTGNVLKVIKKGQPDILRILATNPLRNIVSFPEASVLLHMANVDSAHLSMVDHRSGTVIGFEKQFESLRGATPPFKVATSFGHIGKAGDGKFYYANPYTGHFKVYSTMGSELISSRFLLNSDTTHAPMAIQQANFFGDPKLNRNNFQIDREIPPKRFYAFHGGDADFVYFCVYDAPARSFYVDKYSTFDGDYVETVLFQNPDGATRYMSLGNGLLCVVTAEGTLVVYSFNAATSSGTSPAM